MIKKMTKEYEQELTEFLCINNSKKESYIAWLPDNFEEISGLNKENFNLCIEEDRIVGCLGIYLSVEQKVARLLGPMILPQYFMQYADLLYEKCMHELPPNTMEVKIAFFSYNELCMRWCERTGFTLYNAERTMIYSKEIGQINEIDRGDYTNSHIRAFEPRDKEGVALVHPKGVFYTLDELVGAISDRNHLLLALQGNEVMGYVFYEVTTDKSIGEITLLHVKEGARGKGIGRSLLTAAIRNLEQEQVGEIGINVRVENEGAFRLYSKMGFVEKETILAYRKVLAE